MAASGDISIAAPGFEAVDQAVENLAILAAFPSAFRLGGVSGARNNHWELSSLVTGSAYLGSQAMAILGLVQQKLRRAC